MSDKDLNQLVGLKRYAPYKEGAVTKRAKRDTQHRLGQLRQVMSSDFIHSQKKLAAMHTKHTHLTSQKPQAFRSCASPVKVLWSNLRGVTLKFGEHAQAKISKAGSKDIAQADRPGVRSAPTDPSIEERRKLTYATPQLHEAKQPSEKQPKQASPVPSNLTKSQRKNWRRSQKRKQGMRS